MTIPLEHSYAWCRRVARNRARNFYYAFLLLDRPRHSAICALYAFMRHCDDLADEPDRFGHPSADAALSTWRAQLDAALAGHCAGHPAWPAFHNTVRRYRIPAAYFHEMIDGVASDLHRSRIHAFQELYRYCYQVASVVGLSVIHIFGFQSPEALPLAEKCGVAFQLTNILRDVREDALRGRIYLPAEDLDSFGVAPEDLLNTVPSQALLRLMRFQADRAKSYYRESAPLVGLIDRSCRPSLWALIRIYARLLERIEQSGFDVLRR
ncbi:MAG: phytoene/squalene synthase family protein, partial [Gemmatimonadetes bacterium]|nr:phytoene/squalene synthase family protein [Gemmatimonadota bacterium]